MSRQSLLSVVFALFSITLGAGCSMDAGDDGAPAEQTSDEEPSDIASQGTCASVGLRWCQNGRLYTCNSNKRSTSVACAGCRFRNGHAVCGAAR
jgi:hypothetical protein